MKLETFVKWNWN